jgi:hypothetical protein
MISISNKSGTMYGLGVLEQLGEKLIIMKQIENARLLDILYDLYKFLWQIGYKGMTT